jgi:hypothetical protein
MAISLEKWPYCPSTALRISKSCLRRSSRRLGRGFNVRAMRSHHVLAKCDAEGGPGIGCEVLSALGTAFDAVPLDQMRWKARDLHRVPFMSFLRSGLSGKILRYSNLPGSHTCSCSAMSRSASHTLRATATRHCLQKESVVPSALSQCTKVGCNVRGMRIPRRSNLESGFTEK